MAEENNNWGGRREGAGRKRTEHGRHYSFLSTPETDRILESVGRGKTAFINEAIEFYARHKGLL